MVQCTYMTKDTDANDTNTAVVLSALGSLYLAMLGVCQI